MNFLEKVTYTIAGLMLLLVLGFAAAYWWTTRVPSRPMRVRADATFLWGPAVGMPAPRRGDWLGCWNDGTRSLCQLNSIDGSLEYEGEFVLTEPKRSAPASILKIDPERSRDDHVWIGDALVPLVYLQSGDVLVPLAKYDESVQLLRERGRAR